MSNKIFLLNDIKTINFFPEKTLDIVNWRAYSYG